MPRHAGFTLIEMVIVIILLGVLAVLTTQFVANGVRFYSEASARERLLSDVRFGIERLNRELRDAVPGSVSINSTGQCVSFWPMSAVSRYLTLPLTTSASTSLDFFVPQQGSVLVGDYVSIYPVGLSVVSPYACTAGTCTAKVTALAYGDAQSVTQIASLSTVAGANFGGFASPSPANRVYFSRQQVQFCQSGSQLIRTVSAISSGVTTETLPMADYLTQALFFQDASSFNQNNEVGIRLVFSRNSETVQFTHKVEVTNVP